MLLSVSLAMMLAGAPAADPVGAGRKAFSTCLSKQIQPAINDKMSLADFQAHMKQACADQESAFRAAIVAQDKADRMSDKDAQADADDQVAEYVDKITGEFEDYSQPG
ncbi:hypothetical protein J3E64_000366 [Sphingobium sp. OAS761]|uniref:hypothetical protein n=1 Tax=Sphingobium sp. OAS761 TaxID=2817901 RepID=UPI0020A1184D|nr:hypothetical protein [Sphingobium sp. OAS761]MCP1468699.1 hypothetical protein [Sphingobium sp. OAS761]